MAAQQGEYKGGKTHPRYKVEYARIALTMCRMGAIDKDLAEAFGVSLRSINNWKKKHPLFADALSEGKPCANAQVEEALFKRAIGAVVKETKVLVVDGVIKERVIDKEFPADTKACLSWLANRDPDRWSISPTPKEPDSGHEDWLDSLDEDDDDEVA